MQSSWRTISLCLTGMGALATLAGCGGGGGGGGSSSGGGGGGGPTPPPAVTSVSATAKDGLVATLSESSATVAVGANITYTLTLSNNTGVSILINSASPNPTQPSATLVIKNSSGAIVYTPLPGAPPLDSTSLSSGQSLTMTQNVSAFSSADTYSASATFSDPNVPVTVGPLTVTAK